MRVKVEIADTPYKLAKGLMNRERLASDAGMLFVFGQSRMLSFWGENTLIPLDIAFITRENKIAKIGRIEKLSKKAVGSDVPCTMAVEVNAGFFDAYGIKVGDRINVEKDRFEGTVVQFEKIAGDGVKRAERTRSASITEIVAAWGRPKKVKNYPGQMDLPFGDPDRPVDEDQSPVQSPPEMQGDTGAMDQPNGQDESQLPQLSLDEIPFADDDEGISEEPDVNVGFDSQGNPVDEDGNPVEQPEPQPEQEVEEPQEPEPDAHGMDNYDAINEAIQNNRVMWIQYNTVLKRPKIGPWRGNTMVMRIVEPHGVYHAKTTGNNILVVFDQTAGGIRAFVIDRIRDKAFTGQTFQKKFVVKH